MNRPFHTHPRSKNVFKSRCAEFDTVISCTDQETRGASLLVVRINAVDQFLIAKPCAHCQELIEKLGIRHLYYTDSNGEITYKRL